MANSRIPSIPNLPDETILHSISNVTNLTLTPNDLKNPTPDMLNTIFNGFACNILNVSVEQITQVPLHVLETIAYPELNIEEAVGPLMCGKMLEFLFDLCGISDFSATDLEKPAKKRTKKLFCALTNFYQYYVQNEQVKEDVLNKVESLLKGIEVYSERKRDLKERIANLKADRMEKQKAVQEMNLSNLRGMQEEVANYKEEKRCEMEKLSEETEELQSLVTVTKSSRLIKQAEESLGERIERGNALMKKVKTYTEFGDITPSALKAVEGIMEDANRLSVASKNYEELTDVSMKLSMEAKTVVSQIELKKRILESKEESLARLDSKQDTKEEAKREHLSNFEQKKAENKNKIAEIETLLTTTRHELKSETEKELMQREEHSRNMKLLNEKFKSLVETANKFQGKVNNNCNTVNERLLYINQKEE